MNEVLASPAPRIHRPTKSSQAHVDLVLRRITSILAMAIGASAIGTAFGGVPGGIVALALVSTVGGAVSIFFREK